MNPIREHTRKYVTEHAIESVFDLEALYQYLHDESPNCCNRDALTPDGKEPRWKKTARYELQTCKVMGLVEHDGKPRSGRWRRL